MRFDSKIFVVLSCVLVEISDCADRANLSHRTMRRSNFDKNAAQSQSAQITRDQQASLRLATLNILIEEKLERIEKLQENVVNILTHLEGLNDKILEVDRLPNEEISFKTTQSINAKLSSMEKMFGDFDRKISKLINQSDKHFDNVRSEALDQSLPLIFPLPDNARFSDIDIISQHLKDSLENIGDKIQKNLVENSDKLEYLKRYLEIIFEQNANKNISISRVEQLSPQVPRKQRKVADHTKLINEILRMVRERLRFEDDDDSRNASDSMGSLTETVSSFENMKSPMPIQKNKSSRLSARKVIFPNIKNKPAKINTTSFVSEAFGNKDIRVSLSEVDYDATKIMVFGAKIIVEMLRAK